MHYWELRVREAWVNFGEGNGCAVESELHAAVRDALARHLDTVFLSA